MIKNLLLTSQQYDEKRASIHVPYIYSIAKGEEQCLVYFGAKHTQDFKHTQFSILQEEWKRFLEITGDRKKIVFIEGGRKITGIYKDEKEAITDGGEAGLVHYLAYNASIPVESPDAPKNYLFNELAKEFSREYIVYLRAADLTYQWNRIPNQPDFNLYLGKFLERDRKALDWPDFDFSIEHIRAIHKKIFDTEFDERNKEFFYKITNPHLKNSIINKISQAETILRDVYVVEQVKRYWDQGFNIFIVFGSGHAIIQEPALRILLA